MYVHLYIIKGINQDKQQFPQRKLKLARCSHSILYVQNIKVQVKEKINSFGG